MRRPGSTRMLSLLFAIVAAVGLLAAPGSTAEVRAATPDLTITGDARYVVQPAQHRVRVTVDLTLANHLKDTKTTRYYFDHGFLAVMPQSSAYHLTWAGSGSPSVRASKRTKDYTILRLGLAKRLYGGQSAKLTLRFDIADPGGKPTRNIRIGDSLVSFPVWAFASDATPGGSVTVTFPAGYRVDVEGGRAPAPNTDAKSRTVFRTGRLAQPLSFYAFLVGDRPGAYATTTVKPVIAGTAVPLTVRSWPEDKAWRKKIGDLVGRGLPALSTAIGLPWPRTEPLVVQEAVSRSTGGYAGLFDPAKGLVEIAYYANDFVVLHESAHSWFNGALLADRWANEAFASYYGLEAAKALKVKATGDVMTPKLQKAKIPLNAWGAVGRESAATEDYAYAATLALARAIAKRAGDDGLQAVWADAAGRIGAYQPPAGGTPATGASAGNGANGGNATPELVDGPPDWRGFLDLLEARTSADYDDLWRTWVARDTDLPLLDARAAARTRYDAVVAEAGDWQLPRAIRDAMRAWRFDDATALLDQVGTVLGQRSAVEQAAKDAGLTPPPAMQAAFEGDAGLAGATAEATAELQAIDRYTAAVASRPTGDVPFTALGLMDVSPDVDLASAREAFASGDLAKVAKDADSAAAAWTGAGAVGQGRAMSLAVLLLAVVLTGLLIVAFVFGRRRRRRHRMHAHLIKR
jgi:hypothetical protein